MGVGLGLTGWLGIGKESTYGTPVARTNFFEINDESLAVEEGRIESAALAKVGIRNTKVAKGAIGVAGDFSFDATYAGWERLLDYLLGGHTSIQPDVTSNPSVWDHVYSISDSLPTSMTMEVFRGSENFVTNPNYSFIYEGCQITSGTFNCGADDLLKCGFSVIGEDENKGAMSTPVYTDSKLAVYHQGLVKWNNDDVEVSNFSITINNALEGRPKLGSRKTRQPKRSGKLEVTGSFQAEFVGWDEYNDFRNATERAFAADFTDDSAVISGSYYSKISFAAAIAKITNHRVVLNTPGRLIMEVAFKAYRTNSAGEITITLRNNTTASLAN